MYKPRVSYACTVHTFSLTGFGMKEMFEKMAVASSEQFEKEVVAALVALTAEDYTTFDTFEPAVQAVAGWRLGGVYRQPA